MNLIFDIKSYRILSKNFKLFKFWKLWLSFELFIILSSCENSIGLSGKQILKMQSKTMILFFQFSNLLILVSDVA